MKSRKNKFSKVLRETSRTDELVYELQSTPIPFEIAFWKLIDLTRELERELAEIQDSRGQTETALCG